MLYIATAATNAVLALHNSRRRHRRRPLAPPVKNWSSFTASLHVLADSNQNQAAHSDYGKVVLNSVILCTE